ncbi:Polygalacturonase inhibitor-like protein [Drosera capensis]
MEIQRLISLPIFFLITTFTIIATAELCHPQDKEALLQIKQDFGNPRILRSWTSETDCCSGSWYLVGCDEETNRVNILKVLYTHSVTGQISPAIGNLTGLQILSFSKLPNLGGTIPYSITNLNNLYFLEISYTGISGPVPSFLGTMTNLVDLLLSGNKFTGAVPTSLAQLSKVENLDLARNRLSGTVPEIYGSFKNNYVGIHLSHNLLTGTIPRSYATGNFSSLDVSRNRLTGDASFLFGNPNLNNQVNLAGNQFEFDFSRVKVNPGLQLFDISRNKIYGSIPRSLTKLTGLRVFNVSYNNLCGEIPDGGDLQNFNETSYFYNKCLCGAPLPPC